MTKNQTNSPATLADAQPVTAAPLRALRHHVTGAIERGEAVAIAGVVAAPAIDWQRAHDQLAVLASRIADERDDLRAALAELLEATVAERGVDSAAWGQAETARRMNAEKAARSALAKGAAK